MFSLKKIVKNKDKRENFVKEVVRHRMVLNEKEFELLYKSYKIDDIENFLNFIGKTFSILTECGILEERIPSQKELPEIRYLKKLDCSYTNIKEIPYLEKLKFLNCINTNIDKIPNLKDLEILICLKTNIKEIPYLPNLKEIYPKNIKMKDK